jgi:mannose-6-phosphate isomerase-like protein (cupin superfamily)
MSPLAPLHRVVTGHAGDGRAIITSDGPPPTILALAAIPGTVFHEIWSTQTSPAPVDNGADPTLGPLVLSPPHGGTRIRVVDIPPDTESFLKHGAVNMQGAFSEIGEETASTVRQDSPHPLMHRTESVDYGVVLAGEITLVLDESETVLRPGSIVVQRGTNHAWANRSGRMARMVFILVSGCYAPELRAALAERSGQP